MSGRWNAACGSTLAHEAIGRLVRFPVGNQIVRKLGSTLIGPDKSGVSIQAWVSGQQTFRRAELGGVAQFVNYDQAFFGFGLVIVAVGVVYVVVRLAILPNGLRAD